MIKTITITQTRDIEMNNISNCILRAICDYLIDYEEIDSPEDMIPDYNTFIMDALKNTINYISKED